MDGVAAAQNGAGLGVIQDFEEVVLADQRAPGAVRLPQLFLHRTHGYGPVVYGAGRPGGASSRSSSDGMMPKLENNSSLISS